MRGEGGSGYAWVLLREENEGRSEVQRKEGGEWGVYVMQNKGERERELWDGGFEGIRVHAR